MKKEFIASTGASLIIVFGLYLVFSFLYLDWNFSNWKFSGKCIFWAFAIFFVRMMFKDDDIKPENHEQRD